MKTRIHPLWILLALVAISCATNKERVEEIFPWPDSESYMLAVEAGFQSETVELKEGRFRYWFSSDVILPDLPQYPEQGEYQFRGNQLLLSNGRTYTVRSLQGVQTLWRPQAIQDWDRRRIIDIYGILLPVENIHGRPPSIESLFAEEQWNISAQRVQNASSKK